MFFFLVGPMSYRLMSTEGYHACVSVPKPSIISRSLSTWSTWARMLMVPRQSVLTGPYRPYHSCMVHVYLPKLGCFRGKCKYIMHGWCGQLMTIPLVTYSHREQWVPTPIRSSSMSPGNMMQQWILMMDTHWCISIAWITKKIVPWHAIRRWWLIHKAFLRFQCKYVM